MCGQSTSRSHDARVPNRSGCFTTPPPPLLVDDHRPLLLKYEISRLRREEAAAGDEFVEPPVDGGARALGEELGGDEAGVGVSFEKVVERSRGDAGFQGSSQERCRSLASRGPSTVRSLRPAFAGRAERVPFPP